MTDPIEITDPVEMTDAAAQAAEDRVAAALRRLDEVRDVAPADQVAAFAQTQRILAATLSDIDNE